MVRLPVDEQYLLAPCPAVGGGHEQSGHYLRLQ
ncbi:Uncharacterised protein [Vibrio cholerae]|nr:Uncharacterised protein [Vibrio cholerae]